MNIEKHLELLLNKIAFYCNDICKKSIPGEYPTIPEKCPFAECPLWCYRVGKLPLKKPDMELEQSLIRLHITRGKEYTEVSVVAGDILTKCTEE